MDLLDFIYSKSIFNKERLYILKRETPRNPKIICILRIRNEELILEDTLHHLASFSDGIICYDDASTDETFNILKNYKKVIAIIRNYHWERNPSERVKCETSHRLKLLTLARRYNPEWIFCADADERYLGDIRRFIESAESHHVDIVRISLFDAYMTKGDNNEFVKGKSLLDFRTYFGPEHRDIIMLWKAKHNDITFVGDDAREPLSSENKKISTKFYCQHYGKSLSIRHWEETCDYYINFMPYDSYGSKWEKRKGKAIHELSDFGRKLYKWDNSLFENSIKIYP